MRQALPVFPGQGLVSVKINRDRAALDRGAKLTENTRMHRAIFAVLVLTLGLGASASLGEETEPPKAEAVAKAEPEATLEGTWMLAIPMPGGVEKPTLRIRDSRGKLKGTLRGKRGSKRIRDLTFEGSSFSFNQVIPTPQGKMTMKFRGSVRGDRIQGVIELPLGILPFSGSRKFD
jgi:hypothetical protein